LRDESGVTTIEFVIVFPIFFGFFLMSVESGLIAVRHVMLERGVDITVREVRLGNIANPTRQQLRESVCEVAGVIPDCLNRIEIEMTRMDPTVQSDWDNYDPFAECVDLGNMGSSTAVIDPVANNQLMIIRTCARINPFLPTSILGKAIIR
jgi:Flp pilus assembly protein TadG